MGTLCILMLGYGSIIIFRTALSIMGEDATLNVLIKNENLVACFVVTIMFVLVGTAISIIVQLCFSIFDVIVASSIADYLIRLCIPISILLAMLITLNENQFAVLGTSIAFVTILLYLAPHNSKDMLHESHVSILNFRKKHNHN
jgi:hypothetical protein